MELRWRPDRLRAALHARRMTQKELAERIGASEGAVSQWLDEQKPRTPSGVFTAALEVALEVRASWLYGMGDDNELLPSRLDEIRRDILALQDQLDALQERLRGLGDKAGIGSDDDGIVSQGATPESR